MSGFLRSLPLPPGSFLSAWAADPERFADLLPNPFAEGAAARAAEAITWSGTAAGGASRPREAVCGAVLSANREWGADAAAMSAAERLSAPDALAVVTGQQPGLFGGPLYSLVKAMSAVAAAREVERDTGRPTIPVFWIEGDDHDFEEIRAAWVLGADGEPQSFRYEPTEGAPGLPAFRRLLDESVGPLLDEVAAALPRTEFTDETLAMVTEAYAPGRSLVEAFGRLMLALSRETGLVVLDPTMAAIKRAAVPMYRVAATSRSEGRRRIESANARLAEFGFRPQAATDGYGVFSTDGPDERRRRWEPESRATEPPPLPPAESLSAAVLLRPLVQDFLLPTIAYIGGPSELAYHAQIGGLYDLHGIPRPLVLPRHQVTILTPAQQRVLDRDGVAFDDLAAGDESALNRLAADPAATDALASARSAIESGMDAVESALTTLDPTLTAASQKARGRIFSTLSDLESKALRAAKRRDEDRRRRYLRTRSAIFPAGVPQERRLSPAVFVNRYGPSFAVAFATAFSEPAGNRRCRNLLNL